MYIKNKLFSALFRVAFIIACGTGLTIKLLDRGISLNVLLSDFSLLVCALALIYYIYLLIARPNYERGFFRGAVTIYLLVILIVNFILTTTPVSAIGLDSVLIYIVSPFIAITDYLLFCPKGAFHPYNPLTWAILPAIFNLAILLANHFVPAISGSVYFTFLDMGFILSLLVFLGVGYILFVADSMMSGRFK